MTRDRERSLIALAMALLLAGSLHREASAAPCPVVSGGPEAARATSPLALREGMLLGYEDLPRLLELLPAELWRLREVFFHPGMRLEVGSCQRAYATSPSYLEATRSISKLRLDADGNLRGYTAGLPFPPGDIDPDDGDAALRWAWNLELRHRGPAAAGRFRLIDMPSRLGGIERYEGEWTYVAGHAARGATGEPLAAGAFVSAGRFHAPTEARHLAWRQLRPASALVDFEAPDDILVYIPSLRKVRRAAASWVDGLYMPSYRTGGRAGGGVAGLAGAGGVQVTEHLRRGFLGLSLRPNAYRWRLLGERDVLAPLNASRPGYPVDPGRGFGPSGLSLGDDRWDVRRAVVIQGALRTRERGYDFLTLYVDRDTQQPLYLMTHTRGRRLIEVGILAHRYSGDRSPEPLLADGSPVRAFEPVAAVFHQARDGGSGWRRESYQLQLTPPGPGEIERLVSRDALARGR